MPAVSPNSIAEDLPVHVSVRVNGQLLNESFGIISIEITHEINHVSCAQIILQGEIDIEKVSLDEGDHEAFEPGNLVSVKAGYGNKAERTIFDGIIIKQGLQLVLGNSYQLSLTCRHEVVKMTFQSKMEEFGEKTDHEIMTAIFKSNGIPCKIDSTGWQNENFYQKLVTDWDIILSRAAFNGFFILLDGDIVKIGKPSLTADATLKVSIGESILSFEAELSGEGQASSVEANAWDSKTQALLTATAAEPAINMQGSLSAKSISSKFDLEKLIMQTATALSAAELKSWADAKLLRMRLSAIRGTVSFIGNADIKTGGMITLNGVGKKFNGDAFVSSVKHSFSSGFWKTTAGFGLDNKPVSEAPNFSYHAANGQIPSVQGLQIGIVKKLSTDPLSGFRILITIPSQAANPTGIWARMANFYATDGTGSGFLPEINDEVVIGFLDNDPRFAVILGSLYSTKNASPNPARDENNFIKSITTKARLKLSFDDENKDIKIETPGANTIIISDQNKSIVLSDQNNNSIKMDAAGIILSSPKDITIDAKGKLTLTAATSMSMVVESGDVEVTGLNIKHMADISFSATGNATAEISASGQTTVKGAMVMIN